MEKKTYVIVPRNVEGRVQASSPEEALAEFTQNRGFLTEHARTRDFFEAIEESEYLRRQQQADADTEAHARLVKSFMFDELLSGYEINEANAREVAEAAYELYCRGDSDRTEYECIDCATCSATSLKR